MNVVVIIPTYNEKENIYKILEALNGVFLQDQTNAYSVLVVDGNSTDGTPQVVETFRSTNPRTYLLKEEKKSGLGNAYIYGFEHAMNKMDAEIVVEMDADFQHLPLDVLKLVKEINNGADYVIGSRFVKGGTIPNDWALYRKILSIGGNLFTKMVLGVYGVNDFTSGFKAARVKGFLNKVDMKNIRSKGFAYKMDFVYRMYKLGAKIKEIPITFGLRDRGDSKMETDNAIDSLRVVLSIALRERKSFIKFVIVGFVGLFVDSISFNLLRVVLSSSILAAPTAGLLGMLTTFTLNNFWSFGERKIEGNFNKAKSVAYYVGISLVPLIIRTKLVFLAIYRFGDTFVVSNVAFLLGIIFGLVWNYTMYSRVIWKKNKVKK